MQIGIMELVASLVAVVGGFKALDWVIEKITKTHDKSQKIDENATNFDEYKKQTDKKIAELEKSVLDAKTTEQKNLENIKTDILKTINDDREEYLKGIKEIKESISEITGTYEKSMLKVELKIDNLEKNNTRHLEQLKEAQNKHNNLMERTFILERDYSVHDEMIKVANNRIKDLETNEKNKNQ